MTFTAGNTYLFPLSQSQTAHLWVICTDPNPDEQVLVVSLTSLNGSKDQTVILHGGEHPFLRWATCVAYGLSELISCEMLRNHIQCGRAKMHANLGTEKTQLILDGFLASDFTKKRILQFVRAYKEARRIS